MQDQGAPVATARVVRRLPIDRWFYIGMAICAINVSVAPAEHRCGTTLRLSRQGIARSSRKFSRTSKW